MKAFKINRNSWHYKLNRHFFSDGGLSNVSMQNHWEPRHSDFCSYWRATIFRLIAAAILVVIAFFALSGIGIAAYMHPYETLKVVAGIIIFFGVVIGVIAAMVYFDKSKKKMEQSLFVQKYRAHKSKICPMVEYDS